MARASGICGEARNLRERAGARGGRDMQRKASFRACGLGERRADLLLHAVGIVIAPPAVLALIWAASGRGAIVVSSIAIYGAGLLAMVGFSALYHFAGVGPRKELLRRFDHAAIFLLIAATYTPFTLNKIGGPWGARLFAFVWSLAAAGMLGKLLWPRALERVSIVAYLLLGWSVLVAIDPLVSAVSTRALALLAAGGLFYSVGIVFHLWDRLPYQNAIWHAFVLVGASCHYAAILYDVVLPPPS